MGFLGLERRGSYHRYYQQLEKELESVPDYPEAWGADANIYVRDLNLNHELARVPTPARILDVGCGHGFGTNGLAQRFRQHRFVGINAHLIPMPYEGVEMTVPIVVGRAEELNNPKAKVVERLKEMELYPADVVIARSMLEVCLYAEHQDNRLAGLTRDALRGIFGALGKGGIALIYDESGPHTYWVYAREIINMGACRIDQIECAGFCSSYLRVERLA